MANIFGLRLSWSLRKRIKLYLVFATFGMAGAAFALWLSNLGFADVDFATIEGAEKRLERKLGWFGWLLNVPLINTFVAQYPSVIIGAVGFFVVGGVATLGRRSVFHDRFLASFNDDLLRPVGEVLRPDREHAAVKFVQLPWILGANGPRRAAWDALDMWARGSDARPSANDSTKLSMAVLVGRAGSGKSRMAYEFARSLARRDLLGGKSPAASLRWRILTYLRRVTPFVKSYRDDPWDAGILQSDDDFALLCADFSNWRPRRPTILLLDDPLEHWCRQIWEALTSANGKRKFSHPVRLLILNQTVPHDTPFRWSPSTKEWTYDGKPASSPPVRLPPEAWFTEEETRQAAFGTRLLSSISENVRSTIRKDLHTITKGNPLLVQLAIEWILEGRSVEALSGEVLSAARASKILVALRQHGVTDESQLAALILATLIGGGAKQVIEAEVAKHYAASSPLPSASILQSCFPTEPLNPDDGVRIPAIRPDIIGDAFVERALFELGSAMAARLVESAFRIRPEFMLRSLSRPRAAESRIAAALTAIDPASVPNLDPVKLTIAFADVFAICDQDTYPLSTAQSRGSAGERVRAVISRLNAAQRASFCQEFTALCGHAEASPPLRRVKWAAAVLVMWEAANQEHVRLSANLWLEFLDLAQWEDGFLGPTDWQSLERTVSEMPAELEDRIEAALEKQNWSLQSGLFKIWMKLSQRAFARGNLVRAYRFSAAAKGDSVGQCNRDAFEALNAARSQSEPQPYLEAITALRTVVDALTRSEIADDYSMMCGLMEEVDAIGQMFPDHIPIQSQVLAASMARLSVCGRSPLVRSDSTKKSVDTADRLSEKFPNEVAIQSRAVEVFLHRMYLNAIFHQTFGGVAARMIAGRVKVIAASFPTDDSFTRQLARLRAHEAEDWSLLPNGQGALDARSASTDLLRMARRHPEDSFIVAEAIRAAGHEAYAWNQVPKGARAEDSRKAANQAMELARPFPDHENMQYLAMMAKRYEGFAFRQMPNGMGVSEVDAAAGEVMAIASRFITREQFRWEAAEAWEYSASAWSEVPDGAGADKARRAGRIIANLAEDAPDDRMTYTLARALCMEAMAWRNVPGGLGVRNAATAAGQIEKLNKSTKPSVELCYLYVQAKAAEAQAWAAVENGDGSEFAEAAAAHCLRYAAVFPEHENMAFQTALAVESAVRAWSGRADKESALKAQNLANSGLSALAAFDGTPRVGGLLAMAKLHEAKAWEKLGYGVDVQAAADDIWRIANVLTRDRRVEYFAISARLLEVSVWAKPIDEQRTEKARKAHTRVADIAERWPGDQDFQSIWMTATRLIEPLRRV